MSNLPVSALIRQSNQFGAEDGMESGKRKSKDEYRKQKDLEEQRKAGTAPAMVDVETGRDINPHIPEFIEKTPWYIPHSGPTLKHQRPHEDRQKEYSTLAEWYPKGTTDRVAFKYRDGACENCGAMGHSKKNCFEKPRTVGAKWTNSNIAPDDYNMPKLELGWDAKRDRWNGYNPDDYKLVVQEFEKMDETRKLIRTEQLKETGEEEKLEQLEEQDEDIYAEDASAPGQSVDMDSRTRITVRNLRIREDTAKYLYSLDTNGPYYDPKSRSMRENPFKGVPGKEQEAAQFSGENFARFTGEVAEANEAQVFAWQARCKGIDVHSLAEPTRLEALKKEFEKQKEHSKSSVQNELLEKYGGEEHLSAPPKELLLAQSENYVEYNRKGKVIKGDERPAAKSKYTEDALINNHTAIWGSYWRDSRWGYACCHQFLRNSYCIGEQGILVERAELGPPMADRRATASASGVQLHQQNSAGNNNSKATLSTEMEKAMKTLETIEEEEAAPKKKTVKVKEKDDGKAAAAKRDKNDGDDEHSSNSSASSADEKSASEEEEEMDEEERQRYEEQLEKEKQKKLRDDKRREARRDKRRRRKEKAKQREGEKNKKKSSSKKDDASSGSGSSSGGAESDDSSSSGHEDAATNKSKKYPKELKKAIKKQLKQKAEGKALADKGDRKRKYHRGLEDQEQQQKPSEVDREAYNLTRIHSADPMARFFEEKEEQKRTTTKTKKTRVE